MIRIAWRPLAPCPRSNANCAPSRASAAALGRNCRPDSARPKAFTPGASSAAMRPGPRSSSMISWRSAAVAQPAPKATFSAVVPLTCGTPHRSRVIVTPLRGRSTFAAFSPGAEPERLALEEPAQIGVLHVVAQPGETLVERDLVGRVLREDDAARLARREDVPCLRRVVGGRLRGDGAGCHRGARDGCGDESSDEAAVHSDPFGARFERGREAYVRRRTFVGRWTCSFPSRRRCSRCASPPSWCAATGRATPPSSSRGRRRSHASRPARRRSRGAPRPAGTTAPSASTTCSEGC